MYTISGLRILVTVIQPPNFSRPYIELHSARHSLVNSVGYNRLAPFPGTGLDDWNAVLFQRRHIEALHAALKADGHQPAPLDFNVGFQEMDRFIDMPPFDTGRTAAFDRLWRDGWQGGHLKVMVDGFAVTSFGLVVRAKR